MTILDQSSGTRSSSVVPRRLLHSFIYSSGFFLKMLLLIRCSTSITTFSIVSDFKPSNIFLTLSRSQFCELDSGVFPYQLLVIGCGYDPNIDGSESIKLDCGTP